MTEPDSFIIRRLTTCARCGGEHADLKARRLDNPADEYHFWTMCPVSVQPILVARIELPEEPDQERPHAP